MPDHYQWDGVRAGGFSELGKVLTGLRADLKTVRERVTPAVLSGVSVFIIVDPDTPAETADPKYILPEEIDAIEKWVRGGGRLVLLGNDKGNAEFQALMWDVKFGDMWASTSAAVVGTHAWKVDQRHAR